jgi:hypothetical protein
MPQPQRLDFPLAKAEYLLTRVAEPGKGGDKQNFWQNIMGFQTAEEIRQAILAEVTADSLQPKEQTVFGDRYQVSVRVTSPTGVSRYVITGWIVRFVEDTARFVTAVPDRKRRQP